MPLKPENSGPSVDVKREYRQDERKLERHGDADGGPARDPRDIRPKSVVRQRQRQNGLGVLPDARFGLDRIVKFGIVDEYGRRMNATVRLRFIIFCAQRPFQRDEAEETRGDKD